MVDLDEEPLEMVATDGEMDYNKWPALLGPLLDRLNQIVHHDFPIPQIPPPLYSSSEPTTQAPTARPKVDSPSDPPNAQREISTGPRPLPPVPPFNSSSTSTSNVIDSVPPSQPALPTDTIPDLLVRQLDYIRHTLRTSFSEKPPHTIQRLAELVLAPTKHYKTLPAWLRAVDRVVSVSSTADIFPLPHAQPLPTSVIDDGMINGMVNGVGSGNGVAGILWANSSSNNAHDAGLGSDESLGGALLTPIPWLKDGVDSMVGSLSSPTSDSRGESMTEDAPNPLVRHREDGAVTQGELIRQEQEAGIVPVSQGMGSSGHFGSDEELEERPHARGPDTVDTVDTGLIDGKDVEIKIGGGMREENSPAIDVDDTVDSEHVEDVLTPATIATPTESEPDGDIVLTDADGKAVDDPEGKSDMTTEIINPDAVDSSAA